MPGLILHLNFHEPMRLHQEGDRFLWEELNRDIFLNRAGSIYLPLIKILAQEVEENPAFCFSVGISGTFLEQAEAYQPSVVTSQRTLSLGGEAKTGRVRSRDLLPLLFRTFYRPRKTRIPGSGGPAPGNDEKGFQRLARYLCLSG